MKNPFRNRTMRDCYDSAARLGADNFSGYYYGLGEIGPRWPHRGAGHRVAFWNGWRGVAMPDKTWMSYAFWRAGRDLRRVMTNDPR